MLGRCHRRTRPSSDAPDPASPSPPDIDPARIEGGNLFTVSTRHAAHALVVVRVVGEVDLLTGPTLDRALREAVALAEADRPPPGSATARAHAITTWTPEVLCDLDAVTFFGATGVSVLLVAAERARIRGVMLVVTATSRPVRRTLNLIGLEDRLRSAILADTHTIAPRTLAPRTPLAGTATLRRVVP